MVRVVLGQHAGGVQVALDGPEQRCQPCSVATEVDLEAVAEVTGRVIVRQRTEIGTDEDGVPEYDWATIYDGPGVWSPITTAEDDDAAGIGTETATVVVPALEETLETTASVWDAHQHRWTVTGHSSGLAGVTLSVSRQVDSDT